MSSRIIEIDGRPFALLIEHDDSGYRYLVPPLVLSSDGVIVQGDEILMAIEQAGVTVEMPLIEGASSGDLAKIDQQMATLSEELGVPIGPPSC